MYFENPTIDEVLAHHGIKGQKWGVRRFQNPDGSLTSDGYKRYGVTMPDGETSSSPSNGTSDAGKTSNSDDGKSGTTTAASSSNGSSSNASKNTTSQEESGSESNGTSGKTSAHHQKLVNGYLDKGMSQEDAEAAALRRARTEKILAVTAAITIAAATAYVAKNAYDKRVGQLLPSNELIKNLNGEKTRGIKDAFLARFTTSSSSKTVISSPGQSLSKTGKTFASVKQGKNGEKIYNVTNVNITKVKSSRVTKIYNSPVKDVVSASKSKNNGDGEQMKKFVNSLLSITTKTLTSSSKSNGGSSRKISSSQRRKAISEYKKEHPGTKLSDDEILANYYGS